MNVFSRNKEAISFLLLHLLFWVFVLGQEFPPNFGFMCAGVGTLALLEAFIFCSVFLALAFITKEHTLDFIIMSFLACAIPYLMIVFLSFIDYSA